jgi:hypothetical protein
MACFISVIVRWKRSEFVKISLFGEGIGQSRAKNSNVKPTCGEGVSGREEEAAPNTQERG